MLQTNYSKYGIVRGILKETPEGITCGFVSRGWPGWAIAAKARNQAILVIVLREKSWFQLLSSLFPNTLVVDYEASESWLTSGLEVKIWFSDIDPPRKLTMITQKLR